MHTLTHAHIHMQTYTHTHVNKYTHTHVHTGYMSVFDLELVEDA